MTEDDYKKRHWEAKKLFGDDPKLWQIFKFSPFTPLEIANVHAALKNYEWTKAVLEIALSNGISVYEVINPLMKAKIKLEHLSNAIKIEKR